MAAPIAQRVYSTFSASKFSLMSAGFFDFSTTCARVTRFRPANSLRTYSQASSDTTLRLKLALILFTVITGFFILVICHLQYLAQDSYARGGGWIGRIVSGGIATLFPNFQLFALADSLNAADAPPLAHVLRIGVYGFGYIAAACGLAVFSFRQREI